MSFGSSFVQTLTPTLREILGQAIQTREAKKRYEEYFRMQGELTDQQQENAMAQIAEKERVAQDKATREADAKNLARVTSTALGYLYGGEFVPGFNGGAPEGAQAIYGADTGPAGINKFLEEALNPNAPRVPVQVGGQTVMGTVSDALRAQANAESARNNKARESIAREKKDTPKTPKMPSASELNNRAELFITRAKESGQPVSVEYEGKSYALRYPSDMADFSAAADSVGTEKALSGVLKRGLSDPVILETVGEDGALGDIKVKDGALVINKAGWLKDTPASPEDAIAYLVSKGVPMPLAKKRVADLMPKPTTPAAPTTPTTAVDSELGY
ncbi:MAG: hypothetical protein IPH09_13165 [bacterium]|nr:hypothetical protein [bacterium]